MATQHAPHRRAIIITGPVGSGKTTIMAALTALLEQHNQPCAGIDMDSLRWFYPHPPGDRFGTSIGRKHLAMLTGSYRELGTPTIILADVVEEANDKTLLAASMPHYDVHVIRLKVPMDLIHQRLKDRESPERIQWYLDRAPELEQIMERNDIGDTIIDVGDCNPRQVAEEISRRLALI